jgi:hypothetical protein
MRSLLLTASLKIATTKIITFEFALLRVTSWHERNTAPLLSQNELHLAYVRMRVKSTCWRLHTFYERSSN